MDYQGQDVMSERKRVKGRRIDQETPGARFTPSLRRAGRVVREPHARPTLPGLYVTIEGALPDGLIPYPAWKGDLTVTAPLWKNAEPGFEYWLVVDDTEVVERGVILELPLPASVTMVIPADRLAEISEGLHEIQFYIVTAVGSDMFWSETRPLHLDRTPAGGATIPPITFAPEIVASGVTVAVLESLGNVLKGNLASYERIEAGDQLSLWMRLRPDGTPIHAGTLVIDDPDSPIELRYPRPLLESVPGNGTVEFYYDVLDRAGNPREEDGLPPSPRTLLRLFLVDSPADMLPPVIPGHADGLITDTDARPALIVSIPAYTNAKAGDVIVLHFGNSSMTTPALEQGDIDNDPLLELALPYFLVWQTPERDDPVFHTTAFYDVVRDSLRVSSPSTGVDVDLTLAGGPDPDPETPQHEDYAPPVLTHSGADAEDNRIPARYTAPVVATISHLTTSAIPSELFAHGDIVQLFRYDTDGETRITVGDETEAVTGEDLVIELDDADVVSGLWEFFYEVARELPGGQVNRGVSPTQSVTIDDANDLPGGPGVLPAAIFRNSELNQGFPTIGYERSKTHGGTIVRIYEYINMAVGDSISIHWQGNDMPLGNGKDIPAALYEPAAHVVDATDLVPRDDSLEDDPLPDPGVINKVFVDFRVPYAEMQKISPPGGTPKAYGSAWLTYSVTSAKGSNVSESDRTRLKPLIVDARVPN